MAIKIAPPNKPLSAARKNELLRTLDSFFLQRIQDLFDLFFDEAEFRLFGAAQNALSTQQKTQLFETLAQLKRGRQTLGAEVIHHLQRGAALNAATSPVGKTAEQLALIEQDVFEAQL